MGTARTVILAGGGTGGHLYPGIAVADALVKRDPSFKPLFLCTERELDRTILGNTAFDFVPQPIIPPVRTVSGLLKFWSAWRATGELVRQVLKSHAPCFVLGLGGYAAGVAVKVGAAKGLPAAILNPDVIPGKANQYLMPRCRAVFCQYDETRNHVGASRRPKLRITGCPIRADIRSLPTRESAAGRLGLDLSLNTLVVTGASQGAQTVNDAVLKSLESVRLRGWQVLHLAGKDHASAVHAGYKKLNIAAHVIDFTPAMADVWATADLAVSRSGASSCAELTACGVPSILMPYPFHKDMHQRANAQVLEAAGAAIIAADEKDAAKNTERLRPLLESLMHDNEKRLAMAAAARRLGLPDAAERVAAEIDTLSTRS
jgi:UDP-N-acetylglucosamine--N-acetylmuramyl-(pentapeptide) pyrophosphoryl-undecaprenol N-acetylglucosamine transferase